MTLFLRLFVFNSFAYFSYLYQIYCVYIDGLFARPYRVFYLIPFLLRINDFIIIIIIIIIKSYLIHRIACYN